MEYVQYLIYLQLAESMTVVYITTDYYSDNIGTL